MGLHLQPQAGSGIISVRCFVEMPNNGRRARHFFIQERYWRLEL